jgi:hypothetical protein
MNCDLSTPDATCPRCGFVSKVRGAIRQCRAPVPTVCGPGCHLKRLLAWWGIRDDGRCGCSDFAAQMDQWGPDGCAAREDDILGHLAEASVKRGLPFLPPAARLLIRQAIAAARREAAATPGTAATGPG